MKSLIEYKAGIHRTNMLASLEILNHTIVTVKCNNKNGGIGTQLITNQERNHFISAHIICYPKETKNN